MKPMSAKALAGWAAAHGAKVEGDTPLRLVAPAPQPVEPPAPAYMPAMPAAPPADTLQPSELKEAIASIDRNTGAGIQLAESTQRLLATVQKTLTEAGKQQPERRPTAWVFSVKRDAHGLLETITARARFD